MASTMRGCRFLAFVAGPLAALLLTACGPDGDEAPPAPGGSASAPAGNASAPASSVSAPASGVSAPASGVSAPASGVSAPIGAASSPAAGVSSPVGIVATPVPPLAPTSAAFVVAGTSYYVDAVAGADGNDGRSPATAWKTVARVNAAVPGLGASDGILFRRGQSFFGGLVATRAGVAGAPFVFAAYGSGTRPNVTGFVTLGGWTAAGPGVWESSCAACGSVVNVVLVDGAAQAMGRFPNRSAGNGGYLKVDSHVGSRRISSAQLAAATGIDWTGAELAIRKVAWIIDRAKITAHSGALIDYDLPGSIEPLDGFGFFIQNDPRTLDEPGEWYWDAARKKLKMFFGAAGPQGQVIKASAVDTLFSAQGRDQVAVDGLGFSGANVYGMLIESSTGVTLRDVEVAWSGVNGIHGNYDNALLVDGAVVRNTNNNGLYLAPFVSGSTIRNSLVQQSGMIPGMGKGDNQAYEGMIVHGIGTLVEQNRILQSGYIGICFLGTDVTVRNNLVDGFDLVTADGAGIYTSGAEGVLTPGRKVVGNVILNGLGQPDGTDFGKPAAAYGIGTDDYSNGVEMTGNTIAHISQTGFGLHNSYAMLVSGNTIIDAGQQLQLNHDILGRSSPMRNIAVSGNIVVANGAGQSAIALYSLSDDFALYGSFDYNVYVQAGGASVFAATAWGDPNPYNQKSFDWAGWRTAYAAYDVHSRQLVVPAGGTVRFEVNPYATPMTLVLEQAYTDAQGTVRAAGTLTLAPFSSLVLIR